LRAALSPMRAHIVNPAAASGVVMPAGSASHGRLI